MQMRQHFNKINNKTVSKNTGLLLLRITVEFFVINPILSDLAILCRLRLQN